MIDISGISRRVTGLQNSLGAARSDPQLSGDHCQLLARAMSVRLAFEPPFTRELEIINLVAPGRFRSRKDPYPAALSMPGDGGRLNSGHNFDVVRGRGLSQ